VIAHLPALIIFPLAVWEGYVKLRARRRRP
jgi:hypothetical protein